MFSGTDWEVCEAKPNPPQPKASDSSSRRSDALPPLVVVRWCHGWCVFFARAALQRGWGVTGAVSEAAMAGEAKAAACDLAAAQDCNHPCLGRALSESGLLDSSGCAQRWRATKRKVTRSADVPRCKTVPTQRFCASLRRLLVSYCASSRFQRSISWLFRTGFPKRKSQRTT